MSYPNVNVYEMWTVQVDGAKQVLVIVRLEFELFDGFLSNHIKLCANENNCFKSFVSNFSCMTYFEFDLTIKWALKI